MGWSYGPESSARAMRDYLRGQLKGAGNEVVAEALVAYGHRYWAAVKGKDGKVTVFLALINGDKRDWRGGRGDSWSFGYKDMDESCGPCDVDCPLSILDKADPEPPNEWAREWREKVRAYWAGRAAARAFAKGLKVGDMVAGPGANSPYRVTSVKPLSGVGSNGVLYRLPRNRVRAA